jgi:UDP-N-acetylmuramoylalanine-D-glutamate ligase
MSTIQEEVAKKISDSGNTVKETVISALAQLEINRRVELITKGIAKQDTLKKEFDKINRDDVVTYIKGVQTSAMSDARFKEIKKAEEGLEKLSKALDKALDDNTTDSYNKLGELIK